PAIARRSGASTEAVEATLDEESAAMQAEVLAQLAQPRFDELRTTGVSLNRVITQCQTELASRWTDREARLAYCPAKELLSRVNARLQAAGHSAVSVGGLARELHSDEIPIEVRDLP